MQEGGGPALSLGRRGARPGPHEIEVFIYIGVFIRRPCEAGYTACEVIPSFHDLPLYALLLYTYPGYPGGGSGTVGTRRKMYGVVPSPLALHRFRPMCSLGHLAHVHSYGHAQSDKILAQGLQKSIKNEAQNHQILFKSEFAGKLILTTIPMKTQLLGSLGYPGSHKNDSKIGA